MFVKAKLLRAPLAELGASGWRMLGSAGGAARSAADRAARSNLWLAERLRFYDAWRSNPQGIGAIAPSSRALGHAITRHLDPDCGRVIELGSGTGVFTRAMIKRGIPEQDLVLIEFDAAFATSLARDFPLAEVHRLDAGRLVERGVLADGIAGATVCGLPLLNMSLRQQIRIVRSAFALMHPSAAFYLFTYGVRCPVSRRVLDRLDLRARKVDIVIANAPPAHVWKLSRRGAAVRRIGAPRTDSGTH
ncbi:class I SAM-dependent methyltransferase [Schauerella aestuarii]|uniref:class I SAM-dependent methyltransferase n=1 Tax=Schauerella aestuarii TaxID=2511204 RepID=UPI00137145FE|nr:hypothetical protein [Achromobacter aestuarii]MYZ41516.1 hypothetical protein [Achromobacter aestuarii]